MINFLKKNNTIFLYFSFTFILLISDGKYYLTNFYRFIIFELIIIYLILINKNLIYEIKNIIRIHRTSSLLLIAFIIAITLSYIFSPIDMSFFYFELLRVGYLSMITNIFCFVFLFIFFKYEEINYNKLLSILTIPAIL